MSDKNQSLERGLAILELLEKEQDALGIREVARRLAVSPAIVQRLMRTLSNTGYVAQLDSSQKYTLGYRALSLGASLLSEDNLISIAMPKLTKLTNSLAVNSFLSVPFGNQMIYVLAIQSVGPVSIRVSPGAVLPLHSTGMGKAMLADQSTEKANSMLAEISLEKFTDKTITDMDVLKQELQQVAGQGYALSKEENLPGVMAVGATVKNAHGLPIASVGIAYVPALQPEINLSDALRQFLEVSSSISMSLGCPEEKIKILSPKQVV